MHLRILYSSLCVCTKDGPQGFANAKCIFIMSNIFNPCFYFWIFKKKKQRLTVCFIFILVNKKVEILSTLVALPW